MLEEEDEEDEEIVMLLGMLALYTNHHEKYWNRAYYRVPKLSGLEWVQRQTSLWLTLATHCLGWPQSCYLNCITC
jgi:hypothetical protein